MRPDPHRADDWEIVCPQCFEELAIAKGVIAGEGATWCLKVESGVLIQLATHDSSGRVWDDATCLWVEPAAPYPRALAEEDVMKDALKVHVKSDGTWLEFQSSDGKSALLRIETLAENKVGIVGMCLRQWCRDRQAQASVPSGNLGDLADGGDTDAR